MHQIDWGQVIAQVVGFLVVLWILRKYAWGPVIDMLEERRAKIQGDFDEIETQRNDVASVRKELDVRLRGIDQEARDRIQAGVSEGEAVGNEVKLKARQEAQAILRRAEEQVERERDKAQVALRNEMVAMVLGATEKLLEEKLDAEAHKSRIEGFIDSLSGVEGGGAKP